MKKKKKIALIVDVDNWAFFNIATQIKKNISDSYDFKIIPLSYIKENKVRMLFLTKDCDLIHFFWRGIIWWIYDDSFNRYIKKLGITPEKFNEKYYNNKIISTAIYDHLYLENNFDKSQLIFSKCKYYYTSSQKLFDIYNEQELKYKPTTVIADGIDLSIFYPKNIERFNNINKRKIKIGWVGNSKWGINDKDIKGVNKILKPAIKELIEEGYPIEMHFADRNVKMIPHDKMNDYYSEIDLYICTSKNEGTPNPVLESMACGIPVISTDVGIVSEAFGKKQSKYILEKRTKACLKNKIIYFIEHIDEIPELRQENLTRIKLFTWEEQCKKFKKYFDNIFKEEKNKDK